MDIDKPIVVCIECGCAVSEGWMLYCDRCYRRLLGTCDKDVVNVVYDKSGQRYEFNGRGWFRKSLKSGE